MSLVSAPRIILSLHISSFVFPGPEAQVKHLLMGLLLSERESNKRGVHFQAAVPTDWLIVPSHGRKSLFICSKGN